MQAIPLLLCGFEFETSQFGGKGVTGSHVAFYMTWTTQFEGRAVIGRTSSFHSNLLYMTQMTPLRTYQRTGIATHEQNEMI